MLKSKGKSRARKPLRSQFDSIEQALKDIKKGRFVILVDDEDRENEGDLVIAAEKVTPQAINFMAKHARGLICLALTPERVEELHLPPQAHENTGDLRHGIHRFDRCADETSPRAFLPPTGPRRFMWRSIPKVSRPILRVPATFFL